jgi:hypothetical protein
VAVVIPGPVVPDVAVKLAGPFGADAMWLTTLPDAVAGSESSGGMTLALPVVDDAGGPADAAGTLVGLGVPLAGFGVDGVATAGVVDAASEVVDGAALVVSAGGDAEPDEGGAGRPVSPPACLTGWRPAGSDAVGVGHSDVVELEPVGVAGSVPGPVTVAVAVGVGVASPLVVQDGVSLGLVGGDVSVGAHVGRCEVWGDSSGPSGRSLGPDGTGCVAAEPTAPGWSQPSPSSCALAP